MSAPAPVEAGRVGVLQPRAAGPDTALRERIEAAQQRHRVWEAAAARRVLYVPAAGWDVADAVRRDAAWALRAAAGLLGLAAVPALRWFRLARPGDRAGDWAPGAAFWHDPGVLGRVDQDDPGAVWLNAVFGWAPAGAISPSLQEVVAHEAQHIKDVQEGRPGRDRELLELRARLVARQLVRGAPAPL